MLSVYFVISALATLTFAEPLLPSIEECYSPLCMEINERYSLYKALSTNCSNPKPAINYWWYNQRNRAIQINVNPKWIPYINPSLPFVMLFPGLGEDFSDSSTTQIKDAYFDYAGTPYTVFDIEYDVGQTAPTPLYSSPKTTCNFTHVAESVSQFLCMLNKTHKFQIEDMHLIGVSFGAHLAGIIGNLLQNTCGYTLKRITGLDPLGAGYYCVTCPDLWLKKGDATFVDVIHTNTLRIGEWPALGDIDFYVNWPYYIVYYDTFNFNMSFKHGELIDIGNENRGFFFDWPSSVQPGCHNSSLPDTCSSLRSAALYGESIRYNNFRGTSCHTLYRSGQCFPPDSAYMGLYAKPSMYDVYYVTTTAQPPYGMDPPGKKTLGSRKRCRRPFCNLRSVVSG